jgi:hypothetical protein
MDMNRKHYLVMLLMLAMLIGCSSPIITMKPATVPPAKTYQPGSRQSTPAKPRGIYVYSEHLAKFEKELAQSLTIPGVDGVTLLLGWASIEPGKDKYNWAELDRWMGTAVSAGKNVILAIRAGQNTPDWLFQAADGGKDTTITYAGATPLQFYNSPRGGVEQENCYQVTIAAPWDPVFLKEWDSMLAHVSQHLKSTGTYDALISLRLTGINRTTCELRLPAEIMTKPQEPCDTNGIYTWLKATPPYRPARLLKAWDNLTDSFLRNFPDKYFGVEIIPVYAGPRNLEFPFPAIDDNGCVYQPPWPTNPRDKNYGPGICINTTSVPDQNEPLLKLASQKFADRLSVSYQNLDTTHPADPYPIYAAQTWGTDIGYQVNDYDQFQRSACSGTFIKPGLCDSASYLKLIEVGIYPLGQDHSLKALYIEVLPPDVLSFPHAIQQAHNELHAQLPAYK